MNLAALDCAVLSGGLAQIAQLMATYEFKTDQTAQTDQRIEMAEQFGAPLDQKPTSLHAKLTSGTAQQRNPCAPLVRALLDCSHARPRDGAP